jgi:hypothetical protein
MPQGVSYVHQDHEPLTQYIRNIIPDDMVIHSPAVLALSGWDEAFKNGHVAAQRLVIWQLRSQARALALINGYVAVVCLTEQRRLIQAPVQCRDRDALAFEAITRGS